MFELPVVVEKAEGLNPRDLVVISIPKMGKGSILGAFTKQYESSIVFDLEKGGYEYIDARKVSIYPTQETGLLEAYQNYIGWRDKLLEKAGTYQYLIIDTLTELDKLSEIGATFVYMHKVPMGKNFNRDKSGKPYNYGDPEFRLVTSLPEGAGYKYTREWFMEQIEIFSRISPYRIYAAHVVDKYVKDAQREEVIGSEISLTGKLKQIFSSKVTTLAKLVADGSKRYLSFDVNNDSIIAGSRAPHLKGKILISDSENGEVTTFWNSIYK